MGGGVSRSKIEDMSKIYALGDILGNGRSCTVYKAKLLEGGRMAMDHATPIPEVVAIKVVDKNTAMASEVGRRLDEAKFLVKFKNQYSVTLFEYFETETSVCLVTEFLEGGNIYEKIQVRGHLLEHEAASIVEQLASLVSILGSAGYIHRDIRGDNVMFVDSFSTKIRLINFGNMAQVSQSLVRTSLSIRGSARFLAPETLVHANYDSQVDVWSIGVLLFFLLSGTFPFAHQDPQDSLSILFSNILRGHFDFYHAQWRNVSEGAKNLIRKLLTTDPKQRIGVADILRDPWIQQYSDNYKVYEYTYCEGSEASEGLPEDHEVTPACISVN